MSVIMLNLVVLWIMKITKIQKDIKEWWNAFKSKKNEEFEQPSSSKPTIKHLKSDAKNIIPNQFGRVETPKNFNLIFEVNKSLKPEYQIKNKFDSPM